MHQLARLQSGLFLALILIAALAASPALLSYRRGVDTTLVDGRLAKSFEAHYDETFPAKRLGVNLWAAIGLVVFGEGRPGVVLGREHWLYTSEEFDITDDSEPSLRQNLALIAAVAQELAARKLPLLIAIVPAKARVYSEFLDGTAPASLQAQLHDRLIDALDRRHILTADLLDTLVAGKQQQPTFFRTDTHWTPWGAQLAAAQVAALADSRGLLLPAAARRQQLTTIEATRSHRGDLFNYLPLDPWFTALLPPEDAIDVPHTEARTASDDSAPDLFGNSATPRVVLIGSSYSANPLWNFDGALKQAFGEDVANLAKEGVGPFVPMLRYLAGEELKQDQPRLLIWEIPERALLAKQDLQGLTLPAEAPSPP